MRHRNGDRNQHGGDRAILDRGYGLGRRGDRYTLDRWYNPPGAVAGGGGASPSHLLNTLISYWKLDEGTGATCNDSVTTNHLTIASAGGVSVAGIINTAQSFSGVGYLTHASNSSLQVTSDFTFALWVKIDNVGANGIVLAKSNAGFSSIEYLFQHVAGTGLTFNAGGISVSTAGPATVSTWYHVVAWFDSSDGKLRLRVNDTTTYTSAGTATLTQAGDALAVGSSSGGAGVTGAIDELGFWKRKLTAGEITGLYNGGTGLPFSSFTA